MKRMILIFIVVLMFIAVAYTGFYIYKKLNMNIAEVALTGNWDKVERMIENNTDLNAKTEEGLTALLIACYCNEKEIVELLIDNGVNVNEDFYQYGTPIMFSSRNGNLEIAQILIDNGGDINCKDIVVGFTPLSYASFNGNSKTVKFLIENGADVDIRSKNRRTSIMLAIIRDHFEIVKLIYANIDDSKYSNEEKLIIYSYIGDFDKVKELVLDKKTDPNATNMEYTPLMGAVKSENMKIIDFLIKKGADKNYKGYRGESAKDYAKEKGIELD
mgnify:CR=1 FL=1